MYYSLSQKKLNVLVLLKVHGLTRKTQNQITFKQKHPKLQSPLEKAKNKICLRNHTTNSRSKGTTLKNRLKQNQVTFAKSPGN